MLSTTNKSFLWDLLNKYEDLGQFADSISRVIQGTQSDSDYMTVFSNYRMLETQDTQILDTIVGDNIAVLFF